MGLAKITKLRTLLQKRWKELGFRPSDIIRDANERGLKLHAAQMSRYIKGEKGGPSDNDIMWLAYRWGIPVRMNIGEPVITEGKITYEIRPYNEQECLESIKKVFKNG
jgi:hypothetical protein